MKKRNLFLSVAVAMMALSLMACNNSGSIYNVTQGEISVREIANTIEANYTAGERMSIPGIERLFQFSSRGNEEGFPSYIIRAKVLDEGIEYGDLIGRQAHSTRHRGVYTQHRTNTIQILDIFFGDAEIGDIIEIDRLFESVPLPVGGDVILFLRSERGYLSPFPSPYAEFIVPEDLAYPQSITSSILTRSIPEDLTLEPLNPRNHLHLTIQDLARIAGLCNSPWPGQSEPATLPSQPLYFTLTFNLNSEEISTTTIQSENVAEGTAVYQLVSNLGLQLDKEGYEFIGWYLDEDFTIAVTETFIMPPNNLTIFARWSPTANIWEPLDIQIDSSEIHQESIEVETEPPEIDLEPEEVDLESPEINLEPAQ